MTDSLFKAALKAAHKEVLPANSEDSAKELPKVLAVLATEGRWHAEEEWRIMTWFSTTIERLRVADRDWYKATVECDGQQFSCRCPSAEKAYNYARVYQRILLEQFYSVGPPWA